MTIRRKKIRTLVAELLDHNIVQKPPVPIDKIAKSKGVQIIRHPIDIEDVSGFLYRDKDKAVIITNSEHSDVRQRFTISHELGHFLLHEGHPVHVDRKFSVKMRNDLSSKGVDTYEIEANNFAAELLMPKEMLKEDLLAIEDINLFEGDAIQKLAKKYKVSPQALTIRLTSLELIN